MGDKKIRSTGRKIELLWDCPYCGNRDIRGSIQVCPYCNRPRGTTVKWDTNRRAEGYVSDEIASKENNPDWLCECCDCYNKDYDNECRFCGAPKGANKNYFEVQKEKEREQAEKEEREIEDSGGGGGIPVITDRINEVRERENRIENRLERQRVRDKRKRSQLAVRFGIMAVIAFVIAMVEVIANHKDTVTVDSKYWEYTIPIEECTVKYDEGWSLLYNARELSKEWKFQKTDKVIDHYETQEVEVTKSREVEDGEDVTYKYRDLGNGYAEEYEIRTPRYRTEYYTEIEKKEVPVYKQVAVYSWYYHYEYDSWDVVDRVVTSGDSDDVYWGEVTLGSNQREGNRKEEYTIYDIEGNSYSIDKSSWFEIQKGSVVTLKNYPWGAKVYEISSLERQPNYMVAFSF